MQEDQAVPNVSRAFSISCSWNKLTRQTTSHSNNEVYQKDDDEAKHHHQLHVLPPHPSFQTPRTDPKVSCASTKAVSLINQQVQSLASLKHPLDILSHDSTHVVDLALHVLESILLPALGSTVLDHQALELRIVRRGSICRQCRKVGVFGVIRGEEALLDLDKEAKRYTTTKVGLCDYEIGKVGRIERVGLSRGGSSVGDVVDQVLVVGVCKLLRRIVGDLRQDDRGEAACAGCSRDGVLGQDGVFVCDAGVEERRRWDGGGGHVGDMVGGVEFG